MKAKKIFSKIMNIFSTIILIILVAVVVVVVVLRVSGNTPNFFGYMIFRVSTGSMEPQLMVGDVILSKTVDNITDIKEGDVITYMGVSGDLDGKLVTHEVVKAPYVENGSYYLVTKGIANSIADPVISDKQVIGVYQSKVPFIGALYTFFLTPIGLITAVVLIILAFVGEFFNIYKASRKNDAPPIAEEDIKTALEEYVKEHKEEGKKGD